MKKYFFTDGHSRYGPFTLEELKERNVTPSTLVWHEGLKDWMPASGISELRVLFPDIPPPLVKKDNLSAIPPQSAFFRAEMPPKTWLVESILATLFCCLPFGIPAIIAASKVESRFYAGDLEGAQRAAAEAENWTKVAFFVGLGIIGLYILIAVFQLLFMFGAFFSVLFGALQQ